MKYLILSLLLLSATARASAPQKFVGAVECPASGGGTTVQALISYGSTVSTGTPGQSLQDRTVAVFKRLQFSRLTGTYMAWEMLGGDPTESLDQDLGVFSEYVHVPGGCRVINLGFYKLPEVQNESPYKVNRAAWQKLDDANKVAALVDLVTTGFLLADSQQPSAKMRAFALELLRDHSDQFKTAQSYVTFAAQSGIVVSDLNGVVNVPAQAQDFTFDQNGGLVAFKTTSQSKYVFGDLMDLIGLSFRDLKTKDHSGWEDTAVVSIKGTVAFSPTDNQVAAMQLEHDAKLIVHASNNDLWFPKYAQFASGATISYFPNGNFKQGCLDSPSATYIRVSNSNGGFDWQLDNPLRLSSCIYDSSEGAFAAVQYASDATLTLINGVQIRARANTAITFNSLEFASSCTLAADTLLETTDGTLMQFRRGQSVQFDENGRARRDPVSFAN